MQYILVGFILFAFAFAQSFIGGAKLVFAIPAYAALGIACIITLPSLVRKSPGVKIFPVISTLLLAAYIVWRGLTSPVPGLALPDLLMVCGALCVYLLVALKLSNPKVRLWLLGGCFVLGFLHVVAGVIQFRYEDEFMFLSHLPENFPLPQIFRSSSGWRASGFYVCPNHTAGYLETLCAFAIAYCCWGRFSSVGRIILGYVVVFCLVGIGLTGSRGGFLSVGFGLGVFVMLSLWFLKRLRSDRFRLLMGLSIIGGIAVIGGGAILAMKSSTIGSRVSDINYDAGAVRFDMWQAAIRQFQLSPICGTGAGTYLYYGREFRSPNVQRDPIHVHCDYLELLAEYGVIGCVLMAVFVFAHVKSGVGTAIGIIRNKLRPSGRSSSNELALIAAALCAIAALLAHSVVDFNFHLPANTLFFAAIFGFLAAPTTDPSILKEEVQSRTVRSLSFALPILGAVVLLQSWRYFPGEYHTEWARVHLRNKLFIDNLASFQSAVAWGLGPVATGMIAPSTGAENDWSIEYQRNHLFPKVRDKAALAMEKSPQNVDAPYYFSEALHFLAVYEMDPLKRRELHESAVKGFQSGQRLFPQDSRYDLKLARTLVNLGRFEEAEAEALKAIKSDPNFGNSYAFFGFVLWQQKKLVRAEAYYRKAVSFPNGNDLASAGLRDVTRVRAAASDPSYVERNGDPLEEFDMEPVTPEDQALGVGLAE